MAVSPFAVFLVRLILAVGGGWLLMHFFFPQGGWTIALILAALVLGSAYLSEVWRRKSR